MALRIIAWLVLCGSVVPVAVVVASHAKAVSMARRQQAGSEYIAMMLWPFYLLAPFAGTAGAVAGFWLATRADSTAGSVVLYMAGGVLGAWTALFLTGTVRSSRQTRANARKTSRVLSKDEMIGMIRSRAIRSFTRRSGSVSIMYENYWIDGTYQWLPRHADPDGFDSYVAAALALAPGFTVAFHDDELPPERLLRWITAQEAEDLLARGMVKTFTYGTGRLADEPTSGERTGIKLVDHGWVRHIHVEPPMQDTMIPIARAAQRSHHGVPQFCIDGKYEPR